VYSHFATVCNRITWFSPKCSEKITVYRSMQNLYQLVKYSLINNRNWIQVVSDVTLHVNMTTVTDEVRLLIKTSQTEKDWIVEKIIAEFPVRQWKWHYAVCCLMNNWVYWFRWVLAIDVIRGELIQISSWLINSIAAKTDNQDNTCIS